MKGFVLCSMQYVTKLALIVCLLGLKGFQSVVTTTVSFQNVFVELLLFMLLRKLWGMWGIQLTVTDPRLKNSIGLKLLHKHMNSAKRTVEVFRKTFRSSVVIGTWIFWGYVIP